MGGKIVCGFAGIGKSTAAKNNVGVVDLESTPFNKNWKIYADVAVHMANNGYTVLLSMHKDLRDELNKRAVHYLVAIPPINNKDEYLKRYESRGNTAEFIELLRKNWFDWLNDRFDGAEVVLVDRYLDKELLRQL